MRSPSLAEHTLAKCAAAVTFVLLVIGGTVNPTGSSLACPEPTLVCHGQLFPPMTGGVFYEHGHRLAAMSVGLVQIFLTWMLLRRRKDLRVLAWLMLAMVIAQGALGAITVQYKLPWFVSTSHLLLGMSYFATLVYVAFRTRREPTVMELERHDEAVTALGPARTWIKVATGAVFVQLLLGALVRHLGAAMVCLGMPTCLRDGTWLPDASVQQLHMLHRGFGVVVAIITIAASISILRHARAWAAMRNLALVAPVLVLGQLALGIYTVMTMRSVPVAVGHFAGATALWCLWLSALYLTLPRTLVATAPARLRSAFA